MPRVLWRCALVIVISLVGSTLAFADQQVLVKTKKPYGAVKERIAQLESTVAELRGEIAALREKIDSLLG